MIEVVNAGNPRMVKDAELQAAKLEKQEALLEYVAMMSDVELPETEETDGQVRSEGEALV